MYNLRWPVAGAALAVLSGVAFAQAASDTIVGETSNGIVLPKIVIIGLGLSENALLGGGDASEIGLSKLNEAELKIRSDGTGDINAVLKTLPNVQWQNDTTTDGGTSLSREQDLRPTEVSISGAHIYDNNFMIDGIEINRVAGSEGDARDTLDDTDQRPSLNNVYGGHSQSLFVAPQLIESVTVHDSNVSAEYGRFQGGVVEYKTKDPSSDGFHGGFSTSVQTSDMNHFRIATPDGENPLERTPPEFIKDQESIWLSGPLNERWAAMLSVGRNHAWGRKDKAYQYVDQSPVETETFSETYMAKLKGETEIGTFRLQSIYAPYTQEWDSSQVLNGATSIVGSGSSSALFYENAIGDLGAFHGVNVDAAASINHSQAGRDGETNEAVNFQKAYSDGHVSNTLDMCREDPTSTRTFCRIGTYGDLYENETDVAFKLKATAELFGNEFKMGGGVRRSDVNRERPEEVTLLGSITRQTEEAQPIVCDDASDPYCLDGDQYADRRTISPVYDIEAGVTNFDLYTEYNIDFGRLDLSLGLRADFETYQKNLNVAPRASASFEALKGVTFTGGFGRYYADSMLGYAIRDNIPRSYNEDRVSHGGVVYNTHGGNGWSIGSSASSGSFSTEDLKTPYTDEFTLGAVIEDPFSGGTFRIKGQRRLGRDQFARKENSSGSPSLTGVNTLTNDAKSDYLSASLEYARYWNDLNWGVLEKLGFTGSLTWAQRNTSNNSYFADDDDDVYIYYKGQSYTAEGFNVVTGNLDIPVRATLGLNTMFWDGRFDLWTNANLTLGYTGVADTMVNTVIDGNSHDIYDDIQYRPKVTFNAGGNVLLAETKYGKAELTVRVDNVFDTIGNANASDAYPFKKGRSFWAGLNYTF